MTFLRFVLFIAVAAAHVPADGRNYMTDKCAGIQGKTGQTCYPTACANRNTSCPLIPDALCASDECGRHVAFFAVINQTGRETRIDVTDLCRATVEIKVASDLIEGLLVGEVDKRDSVASDPDVLFRIFKGLNILSVRWLTDWLWSIDATFPYDRTPAMEKRRQYYRSELAALEERMRSRDINDAHNVVTRARNISDLSTKEAQNMELQRRKGIIRQWTKKQERVKVLDESVSMHTLIAAARMASRKYAVDNQGSITGSQLPIYGNILNSCILRVGGIPMDETLMVNDPGNSYKITELYNQLFWIVLDEVIARQQLRRSNFRFALPAMSRMTSRTRFNFQSFAPLMLNTGPNPYAMIRLTSLAAQTAALELDLYSNIVGQSPTTLAGFVEDWNIANDLTEFSF